MARVAAEKALREFVTYVRVQPARLKGHVFSEGAGGDRRYVVKDCDGDTVFVVLGRDVDLSAGSCEAVPEYIEQRLMALVCRTCDNVLYETEEVLCSICEASIIMDLIDLDRSLAA